MKTISLIIPGDPVAKGRPKFFRRGSFVGTYTPEKTRSAEEYVRSMTYRDAPKTPPGGLVLLSGAFYRSIPASWSKKRKESALERKYCGSKPDLDNYIKLVTDALNGLFWQDDEQIVRFLDISKEYTAGEPRIELNITYLEET
jgi:Holliday junction resolvase RusA-like endonuclease